MAVAKETQMPREPLALATVKEFLRDLPLGHWGIQVGSRVLGAVRKLRSPAQRRIWMSQFGLPLRNIILLNRSLTVSCGGISVALEPRGTLAADIWTARRNGYGEIALLSQVLEPGMIFFDVGANAGLFAIYAAQKIGGGQVFAFEAGSAASGLLARNLSLNRLRDVQVERLAFGESAGTAVAGRTTVDLFLKQREIPRVDVMRLDAEGAELMVLRGARTLIEQANAPVIFYQAPGSRTRGFGYHPVEILWLLESCGYSLFALNSETGGISELKSDYNYDSMVIAAKPGHAGFARIQAKLK